jgi:hypothetical protein
MDDIQAFTVEEIVQSPWTHNLVPPDRRSTAAGRRM